MHRAVPVLGHIKTSPGKAGKHPSVAFPTTYGSWYVSAAKIWMVDVRLLAIVFVPAASMTSLTCMLKILIL